MDISCIKHEITKTAFYDSTTFPRHQNYLDTSMVYQKAKPDDQKSTIPLLGVYDALLKGLITTNKQIQTRKLNLKALIKREINEIDKLLHKRHQIQGKLIKFEEDTGHTRAALLQELNTRQIGLTNKQTDNYKRYKKLKTANQIRVKQEEKHTKLLPQACKLMENKRLKQHLLIVGVQTLGLQYVKRQVDAELVCKAKKIKSIKGEYKKLKITEDSVDMLKQMLNNVNIY